MNCEQGKDEPVTKKKLALSPLIPIEVLSQRMKLSVQNAGEKSRQYWSE
jgi:hypothetical protein